MRVIEFYMNLGRESAKQIFEYPDDISDSKINDDYVQWRKELSEMYWAEIAKTPDGKIWHNGSRYDEISRNYIM